MSAADPLVTITGDGTFTGTTSDALADAGGRLEAITALRSLLGDDLEEQIGTDLYLPAALGTESADHLLPASLALLAGTTGDLASYGWRMGPGAGLAWRRATELRGRTIEDSRFALLGYEGPLTAVTLGPVSLAAATFLASGERTLADHGAVRELPVLLAEGILEHVVAMRKAVPGSRPRLLLREDAVRSVHEGRIPSPSGYRRYAAIPAPEIGDLWRQLLQNLEGSGLGSGDVRLGIPPVHGMLTAALSAGARSVAMSVAQIGSLRDQGSRQLWESLAEARESGIDIALVVDPAEVEATFSRILSVWQQLGYGARDLAGFSLLVHRGGHDASTSQDPAAEPSRSTLLSRGDLTQVLRSAPAWAEQIES